MGQPFKVPVVHQTPECHYMCASWWGFLIKSRRRRRCGNRGNVINSRRQCDQLCRVSQRCQNQPAFIWRTEDGWCWDQRGGDIMWICCCCCDGFCGSWTRSMRHVTVEHLVKAGSHTLKTPGVSLTRCFPILFLVWLAFLERLTHCHHQRCFQTYEAVNISPVPSVEASQANVAVVARPHAVTLI